MRKWTDEQLIEAVKTSRNYTQVIKKIGLKSDSVISVRKRTQELQLDTSHFNNSRFDTKNFPDVVAQSFSIAQVISAFGLDVSGANYSTVKRKIKKLDLSTSHFTGQGHLKGKNHFWNKKEPIESYLTINSSVSRVHLKKRLIKEGYLENKCSICGINTWLEQPLVCHLDHINGVNDDNRLENLRLVCPNCHSQTLTYAGRNIAKHKTDSASSVIPVKTNTPIIKSQRRCSNCNDPITKRSKTGLCQRCYLYAVQLPHPEKITWPTKEELEKMIWEMSTIKIASQLGVSDKAVEKRCRKLGVSKPPRGYWAKRKYGKL